MTHQTFKNKTWIKICGLTRVDNALACAECGPDAIGLIFYKKSPRHVTIGQAKAICTALPDSIAPIGVFVDEPYDHIIQTVQNCGLKGVQLHGSEPPSLVDQLLNNGLIVIKALFAARTPFLKDSQAYEHASSLLIEYGKGILPGGNAESWNYEIALHLKTNTPVILAGGLTTESVGQAINQCCPAGVDISSGVEAEYGIKDIDQVNAFVTAVRNAS
jgi:phosphoribosylanthranilate isomerase